MRLISFEWVTDLPRDTQAAMAKSHCGRSQSPCVAALIMHSSKKFTVSSKSVAPFHTHDEKWLIFTA
jgi:hypothetical protein